MEHARKIFKEVASKHEEYNDIKDEIRDLHSSDVITDKEYNYILEEWDSMLVDFNL